MDYLVLQRPVRKESESRLVTRLFSAILSSSLIVVLTGRDPGVFYWDSLGRFDYDWRTDFGGATIAIEFHFKYNDLMPAFNS